MLIPGEDFVLSIASYVVHVCVCILAQLFYVLSFLFFIK